MKPALISGSRHLRTAVIFDPAAIMHQFVDFFATPTAIDQFDVLMIVTLYGISGWLLGGSKVL